MNVEVEQEAVRMGERLAYVNGKLVPESQAVVSAFDRGLRWGDGIYEAEVTFRGKIFKLEQHVDRLYRSLVYTRINPGLTKDEMIHAIQSVAEANAKLLGENDEYIVTQVVTRGAMTATGRVSGLRATVVIYCQLIPYAEFAKYYVQGVRLITPSIRRIPPQCLSPKGKIANRMNLILADLEVRDRDPEASALMLDVDGNITETSAANFMFVSSRRLMLPSRRGVLGGISMETVLELAKKLELPVVEGDYSPFDVYTADEAFLTSSLFRILPVAHLNGIKIGVETPGPVTRSLLKTWSDLVGVDIVARALSCLGNPQLAR